MAGIGTAYQKLTLAAALACAPLAAQTSLTLQEAGSRNASAEFRPQHLGERVMVRGTVNAVALHFPDHSLLPIEDGNYGALIRVEKADPRLDSYRPGDDLQVVGTV